MPMTYHLPVTQKDVVFIRAEFVLKSLSLRYALNRENGNLSMARIAKADFEDFFKQVRKELQSNSHEALFSGSTVTI